MPFLSREFLRLSLNSLKKDYSPLLLVSLPCMLNQRVPTSASSQAAEKEAIPFGSTQERDWLDKYFRPGGGPPGSPYYMPGTSEWVQERYPDRSLQRRRKDFDGKVFFHPSKAAWALRKQAATALKKEVLEGKAAVPLVALMGNCWGKTG